MSQASTTFDPSPTAEMYDTIIRVTISDLSSSEPSAQTPSPEAVTSRTNSETFHVHKGLIIFYSDYFRGALDGNFSEAQNNHVELDSKHVDADIFRFFVSWLYTLRLRATDAFEDSDMTYVRIVRIWVFADAHLVPLLKNYCIDLIFKKFHREWKRFNLAEVRLVYSNTIASSPLRKVFVDIMRMTYANMSVWITWNGADASQWPSEFLCEVIGMLTLLADEPAWQTISKEQFAKTDRCQYHDHPVGVKCCKPIL